MIVACKSTLIYTCKCVCLLGGSGACSPRKILNLDPLRLLVTQSGTRLLCNTCDKTIITILNFMISGGGEFQGPPPPLYETLYMNMHESIVILSTLHALGSHSVWNCLWSTYPGSRVLWVVVYFVIRNMQTIWEARSSINHKDSGSLQNICWAVTTTNFQSFLCPWKQLGDALQILNAGYFRLRCSGWLS